MIYIYVYFSSEKKNSFSKANVIIFYSAHDKGSESFVVGKCPKYL
jgi:hypothetical protein